MVQSSAYFTSPTEMRVIKCNNVASPCVSACSFAFIKPFCVSTMRVCMLFAVLFSFRTRVSLGNGEMRVFKLTFGAYQRAVWNKTFLFPLTPPPISFPLPQRTDPYWFGFLKYNFFIFIVLYAAPYVEWGCSMKIIGLNLRSGSRLHVYSPWFKSR